MKVALVTGGTSGIGRAVVETLAQDGWAVVFGGRKRDAGEALAARLPKSRFVQGDVSEERTVHALVDRALECGDGRIHGLVANAGQSLRRSFAQTSMAEWDRLMAVNTRSVFLLTRLSLDGLAAAGGSAVAVSSIAGAGGEAGLSAYCASKAALIGLYKALAVECGVRARFNIVVPGQIATPMMASALDDSERSARIVSRIPCGRFGTAQDVADAVAWLLSDAARFVNGATIAVDGGEAAGIVGPEAAGGGTVGRDAVGTSGPN